MEERRQKNNDWCVADLHGRVRIESSRLHCGVHGHEDVSEWLKGALLKVLPLLYFFFNRNYESFAVRTRMKSCLIYFLFLCDVDFLFFFGMCYFYGFRMMYLLIEREWFYYIWTLKPRLFWGVFPFFKKNRGFLLLFKHMHFCKCGRFLVFMWSPSE